MTVYLTSDLHIGHRFVSKIRGFGDDVDAHDEEIRNRLSRLRSGDDLWILGDLAANAKGSQKALDMLSELPCRLHLIEGNHDPVASIHRDGWRHQRRYLNVFESVQAFARRRGPDHVPVLMSHYPYSGDHTEEDRYSWARLPDTGAWLCHGHTHQSEKISGPRQIHVGWDAWHRPVAWNEIETIIKSEEKSNG